MNELIKIIAIVFASIAVGMLVVSATLPVCVWLVTHIAKAIGAV